MSSFENIVINDLEEKLVLLTQLSMRVMTEYAKLGLPNVAGCEELRDHICKCLNIEIDDNMRPIVLRAGRDFEDLVCAHMIAQANAHPH